MIICERRIETLTLCERNAVMRNIRHSLSGVPMFRWGSENVSDWWGNLQTAQVSNEPL
jgi:hypothetical protein